jgi:hypothetical protein
VKRELAPKRPGILAPSREGEAAGERSSVL